MSSSRDYVDGIVEQWSRERPDLDVWPMGVIGRISRASRLLERHIEDVFAAHGLHGGRFDVLAALRRAGPPHRLSPTDLYSSLLISSGAMTHRLERLANDGLITRVPDSRDGRSVLVELTEKGREAIDAAVEDHIENENAMLSQLSPGERADVSRTLRKLLVTLGDTGSPEAARSGHAVL